MKIQLLSNEEYEFILNTQKLNPIFTFQNKGYEYIDKSKFTVDEVELFNKITEILKKSIVGFSEFNNFCHNKSGELLLRFQYNYGAEDNTTPFTGVGYILLDELLNGFKVSNN